MNPRDPLIPGPTANLPSEASVSVDGVGAHAVDAGESPNSRAETGAVRAQGQPTDAAATEHLADSTAQTECAQGLAPTESIASETTALGAKSAPGKAPAWDPEKAPAISAAKAAADFVAQIFAEVSAPESASEAANVSGVGADAASDDIKNEDASVDPGSSSTETVAPLQGKNVLILGLGASGLAMARWCVRWGAHVTVADTRTNPPQREVLQHELPQVRFVSGALNASLIEGQHLDAVYRSPGLSPSAIASVIIAANAYGISASGELSLFSMALSALRTSQGYRPAVLAITGTNGKTTVTSLTGQLIERSGKRVAVAGNIGPTLLDTLTAHLDAGTLPDVWVLELSSFQLDDVTGFEPTAATVLNITQDHLDWHGDIKAYAAAKARIFGQTGLMILNREDAAVMQMLPPPGRPKTAAAPLAGNDAPAVRVRLPKPQVRTHLTFGGDMPQRPGDFGIEVVGGMPWLVRAMEADETRKRARNEAEEELHIQRLIPADALRIRGRHNAVNALAALALASAAGCPLAPMLYGLREYRGERHRVEPVGIVHGVEYFDDSKGTNVGATVAALTGLGAERRVVIILGGDGKGQDFSPLALPVSRYARAVVLMGRDAPLIRAALQDAGVAMVEADTLPRAVAMAAERGRSGDAVLMSPACASFDMFKDYEHRAQVFCEAVRSLADDAGQMVEGAQ